jgi:short-subunit dehydrogenase
MARVGAYSTAKAASVSLSAVLRGELADTNIDVSVLCPGSVATRIAETSLVGEAELLEREVNAAALAENNAMIARGADPDRVGEQVLKAMQERQFVIVTHPQWKPLVTALYHEFLDAFEKSEGLYAPDAAALALVEGASPVASN